MSYKKKSFIFWLFSVLIFGLVISGIFNLEPKFRVKDFKEVVNFEYNDQIVYEFGEVCYGNKNKVVIAPNR